MKTLSSLILSGAIILAACQPSIALESPAVGSEAPDFTLSSADGNTHSLSDFKGKYVVLEWLNHGCPFVVKHYAPGNMQALQETHTSEGVIWLSIMSSAPGKQGHQDAAGAKEMAEKKGSNATAVLLDPDGDVGKLYGAEVTPEIFIIDPEGKVVYHGAIDSIRSTDSDDIPDAKNYVTAAFADINAGKPVQHAISQPYGCSVKYKK